VVRLRDGEAFKQLCFASIPHPGFADSYDTADSFGTADSHDIADSYVAAAHVAASYVAASYVAAAHEPATNHAPLRRRRWRRRLLRPANTAGPGSQAMDPRRGPAGVRARRVLTSCRPRT